MVVIANGSVDTDVLAESTLNVNDLMEGLRGQGYFSIGEVAYAVLETNGALSVMPKFTNKPATVADLGISDGQQEMPYMVVSEGRLMEENITLLGSYEKDVVLDKLKEYDLDLKKVFLFTLTSSGNVFIQPYKASAINGTMEVA